jgi:O-antigen/teichoic acid export membrane protein
MVLGFTQLVVLVPVFLHFWTSEVLAAWLVIYAVGNLVQIADSGLQFRAINRLLAFKSSVDCDGRTARFYAAMLRIYQGLAGFFVILLLVGAQFLSPSTLLGFQAIPNFDAAFIVMTVGMLLTLPSNLAAGLYRARGLYGRAVWLQCAAMLIAQLGQLVAIVTTASLLAVTVAYVATQLSIQIYFVTIDAPRLFPFLPGVRVRLSWRWIAGQFRMAFPFAIAGSAEIALQNLPVLLVSAFVTDRVAVAQWGLTRVVAGLLRGLCTQATLPLAAELGHDYTIGAKERLRRLYAHGSVFVTLLASLAVSGLLPFWPDFFALWTRGAIPYDPLLAMTLLIGTGVSAPSILALGYANYSNRGDLLVRTKGLQLAVFLILSIVLTPQMGPLGAAIAVVASDLLVQFGLLALIVIRQTLQQPARHVAFLAALMVLVTLFGWGLGTIIRSAVHWTGLTRFVFECTLWLAAIALIASPLASKHIRARLSDAIPQ